MKRHCLGLSLSNGTPARFGALAFGRVSLITQSSQQNSGERISSCVRLPGSSSVRDNGLAGVLGSWSLLDRQLVTCVTRDLGAEGRIAELSDDKARRKLVHQERVIFRHIRHAGSSALRAMQVDRPFARSHGVTLPRLPGRFQNRRDRALATERRLSGLKLTRHSGLAQPPGAALPCRLRTAAATSGPFSSSRTTASGPFTLRVLDWLRRAGLTGLQFDG